jgi:hypothetical protein
MKRNAPRKLKSALKQNKQTRRTFLRRGSAGLAVASIAGISVKTSLASSSSPSSAYKLTSEPGNGVDDSASTAAQGVSSEIKVDVSGSDSKRVTCKVQFEGWLTGKYDDTKVLTNANSDLNVTVDVDEYGVVSSSREGNKKSPSLTGDHWETPLGSSTDPDKGICSVYLIDYVRVRGADSTVDVAKEETSVTVECTVTIDYISYKEYRWAAPHEWEQKDKTTQATSTASKTVTITRDP